MWVVKRTTLNCFKIRCQDDNPDKLWQLRSYNRLSKIVGLGAISGCHIHNPNSCHSVNYKACQNDNSDKLWQLRGCQRLSVWGPSVVVRKTTLNVVNLTIMELSKWQILTRKRVVKCCRFEGHQWLSNDNPTFFKLTTFWQTLYSRFFVCV